MTPSPLLSIITPCFNRAEYIAEAVESVMQQGDLPVEHIVVDGGSTDGTLDILRQYPHLRLISEPDRGMYDAINKGLRLASAEWVGLLNSDDRYEAGVFQGVIEQFQAHPSVDAVIGRAALFRTAESSERSERVRSESLYPQITRQNLLFRLTQGAPAINAWFFRRQVYQRVGFFDPSYRISADREFLLRLAAAGFQFCSLDQVVYHYRQHKGSMTLEQGWSRAMVQEELRLSEGYLRRRDLPPLLSQAVHAWHDHYLLELWITSARQRKIAELPGWVARASRFNPAWPLYFIKNGLPRLWNFWIKRGSKGEPQDAA